MSAQLVAATAVEKQGSYRSRVNTAIASMPGVREHTEQLGRSARDCAPTSDAANTEGSRKKKHFIVTGIMA